jgi:hypothetical protein
VLLARVDGRCAEGCDGVLGMRNGTIEEAMATCTDGAVSSEETVRVGDGGCVIGDAEDIERESQGLGGGRYVHSVRRGWLRCLIRKREQWPGQFSRGECQCLDLRKNYPWTGVGT